jgi:hypothetical protein
MAKRGRGPSKRHSAITGSNAYEMFDYIIAHSSELAEEERAVVLRFVVDENPPAGTYKRQATETIVDLKNLRMRTLIRIHDYMYRLLSTPP